MLNVTVYLNEATDFFSGFDPVSARLRAAAAFGIELLVGGPGAVGGLREHVFEQLNIDHPTAKWAQQYRDEHNRSLSVGDVVAIDGAAWSVARTGWEPLNRADLDDAISRHAGRAVKL